MVPLIGFCYGACLGLTIANVPIELFKISLGTVLFPAISVALFSISLNFIALPKRIGRIKWVLLSYLMFAFYQVIMSQWGQNNLQHMQFLYTLPFLPVITYVLSYSLRIEKQLKLSLLTVLVCGGVYTIIVSFSDVRAQGMTTGENSTGIVLVLGFIMTLWQVEFSQGKLTKFFLWFCAGIFVYGVFVTASRTAYIMLFVCGAMILKHNTKNKKQLIVVILVITSLLFWFFRTQNYRYQLQRTLGAYEVLQQSGEDKPGSKNVSRRLSKDMIALDISKNNLLFGVGYANNEVLEEWYGTDTAFSHNMYLRLLSETGLVGLILYFIFLLSIFFSIGRYKSTVPTFTQRGQHISKVPSNSYFWLRCGFIGILISSFFIVGFNEKPFWIWLSLISAEHASNTKRILKAKKEFRELLSQ
ncbi:MAG: O-antigen ligase family protein [bacterium]